MRRTLVPSPAFLRSAKRLVKKRPDAAEAIRQTLGRLQADAFDPSLRTHKLKGDLEGSWSSRAGYDLRIVFQLAQHDGTEAILLLSIGTHDDVY